MIKKIKIYLSSNLENQNNLKIIKKYLLNNYHNVIEYTNDNYVLNMLKIFDNITSNIDNRIGIIICNNSDNINNLIKSFDHIKIANINKSNRKELSMYYDANLLALSNDNFTVDEMLKIIKLFLQINQSEYIFY